MWCRRRKASRLEAGAALVGASDGAYIPGVGASPPDGHAGIPPAAFTVFEPTLERRGAASRWGFIPSWAKEAAIGYNARAEAYRRLDASQRGASCQQIINHACCFDSRLSLYRPGRNVIAGPRHGHVGHAGIDLHLPFGWLLSNWLYPRYSTLSGSICRSLSLVPTDRAPGCAADPIRRSGGEEGSFHPLPFDYFLWLEPERGSSLFF